MIRLEIIADRRAVAEDLAGLLAFEDRLEVVAAGAVNGAPHRLATPVDVAIAVNLLSTQLPRGAGPPIVMLSEDSGAPTTDVHAWLRRASSPQAIIAAIIAAAAGLYALTPDQVHLSTPNELDRLHLEKLTARELEVLNLMSEGLANKRIAERLHISAHTAKFHVAQVLTKLRAGSRTEAVRIGIRRGLVAL